MANELRHASIGTQMSQAEWEDTASHIMNNFAEGDILYVNAAGTIVRLAAGTSVQVLVGGTTPSWGPGAWTDFNAVVTITQGAALTRTITYAHYSIIGKLAIVQMLIVITDAGTPGSGMIIGGIPAAIAPAQTGTRRLCGHGQYLDTGTQTYSIEVEATTATTMRFYADAAGGYFGNAPAVTAANGDEIAVQLAYEIA